MISSCRAWLPMNSIIYMYLDTGLVNLLQLLYAHYLKHCWHWPYYGATFYEGTLITKVSKLSSQVCPMAVQ